MKTFIALALFALLAVGKADVATGPDGPVFRNLLAFKPSTILRKSCKSAIGKISRSNQAWNNFLQGHGGNIRPAFSGAGSNWEALKGAGVGIVLLQLEANASHLPHWHRGWELLFVINGNLTVGITSFNATVGTVEYNITNGDALIVENAAAHYVHNRGPGRSINLSAFSSDNPGTQVSSTTLLAFSDTIVQTAFQVDDDAISQLRAANAGTPALYDGLTIAQQKESDTGNFSQALGSTTADLTATSTPVTVAG